MAIPTAAGAVDLGFFASTHVDVVNATPASFQPTGSYTTFAILADTPCHLSVSGSDATTNDFMLLPGIYAIVNIDRFSAQHISWVVASGGTDGTIRITACNPRV